MEMCMFHVTFGCVETVRVIRQGTVVHIDHVENGVPERPRKRRKSTSGNRNASSG